MTLEQGELGDFDPRRDTDALLAAVAGLVGPGGDHAALERLLAALAADHPMSLAEVACGPRSPGGDVLIRAVLPHVAVLEKTLSPRGCYPRLADLAGDAARSVLAAAATRHGAASWLVALSRRIEGDLAGATHLFAAADHPGFAAACQAHAEAGHVEGLVLAAGATGRPEPAAALLPLDRPAALRAAGAALDANPDTPVVAWLAAVWGPEPDALIARMVPHLRKRAAAVALRRWCAHLPRTRGLLDVVIRGMREG